MVSTSVLNLLIALNEGFLLDGSEVIQANA
jgi:hypothetical protein